MTGSSLQVLINILVNIFPDISYLFLHLCFYVFNCLFKRLIFFNFSFIRLYNLRILIRTLSLVSGDYI